MEAARGSDVEVREGVIDQALVGSPAGVGGGEGREEVVGAEEVFGLDEAEALADVLAVLRGVDFGRVGAVVEALEDCEVERAGGVLGDGRG